LELAELKRAVAERTWYHTIELAPGVTTPGYFDLRTLAEKVLPASLEGARCLDVGTFDGFWALEMDKRGAAEVVATDLLDPREWDWPAGSESEALAAVGDRKGRGEGFELVMSSLGRRIERRELSVYDLDPAVLGRFDFVYVGSLLLHLRDPVRAVERVAGVCSGRALFVDAIDPVLSRLHPRRPLASFDGIGRPWWWKPNVAALERMVRSGGFELDAPTQRVRMKPGAGFPRPPVRPARLRHQAVRAELRNALLGDPHAVVSARPRSTQQGTDRPAAA
jgi:tRNA (mo5U34)-methyltransferase